VPDCGLRDPIIESHQWQLCVIAKTTAKLESLGQGLHALTAVPNTAYVTSAFYHIGT